MTSLQAWIADHGPVLELPGAALTVEGISVDKDIAVGTFCSKRASYLGILCGNARVSGMPGAEVWEVMARKRTIARFAVHAGQLVALA